jgi:hypothetical protein
MDRVAADLSPAELLRAGGWHLKYARLLRVERDGDVALALVDGNGNGAEIEVEAWHRGVDGWSCGVSGGFGPLDGTGSSAGASAGMVWAAGHAEPGTVVAVVYRNELHDVAVDEYGLWLFVRAERNLDLDLDCVELPQRWDE